jgi:hypothetical protein
VTQQQVNRSAVGWTWFAAMMMWLVGSFHAFAGLTGIIDDGFYAEIPDYTFRFNVATWSWIHLVVGVIVVLAGFGVLRGRTWARTVGVALATLSIIANFVWLPFYPVWSIVMMAAGFFVIWALTLHGEEAARAWAEQSTEPDVGKFVEQHGVGENPMAGH